jgi:hypothetical protein
MDLLWYIIHTMGLKKIATNIPQELLEEAIQLTGMNQTQTLIEGLKELIAQKKRRELLSMKGQIHITANLAKSRQRKVT